MEYTATLVSEVVRHETLKQKLPFFDAPVYKMCKGLVLQVRWIFNLSNVVQNEYSANDVPGNTKSNFFVDFVDILAMRADLCIQVYGTVNLIEDSAIENWVKSMNEVNVYVC